MNMNNYPEIDNDIIKQHGISSDEYATIENILGRKPNFNELEFSVMWSEHCSYKAL